jgi:hypothetical protein
MNAISLSHSITPAWHVSKGLSSLSLTVYLYFVKLSSKRQVCLIKDRRLLLCSHSHSHSLANRADRSAGLSRAGAKRTRPTISGFRETFAAVGCDPVRRSSY